MEIRVFHTHIEVYPYHMGDNFNFEKSLSKWVEKTSKYGCYEPVGFYVENDILYLDKQDLFHIFFLKNVQLFHLYIL